MLLFKRSELADGLLGRPFPMEHIARYAIFERDNGLGRNHYDN